MQQQYCINCGKLIPIKANFCPLCGAPQHGEAAAKFRANDPVVTLDLAKIAIDETQHSLTADDRRKFFDKYSPRHHLDDAAVVSFMVQYVLKTAIVIPFMIAVGFFEPIYGIVAFGIYLIVITLVALIVHNNFMYWVDEAGFQKVHGILHKQHVTIPYEQIQNVNITKGLLDRILGIARLSIETAGAASESGREIVGGSTSVAEGHLPGISIDDAKALHDFLLIEANRK